MSEKRVVARVGLVRSLVLMLLAFGLMLTGPGKLAIADLEARLFKRR